MSAENKHVEIHSDDDEIPPPPKLTRIGLSFEDRQLLYLKDLMNNIAFRLTKDQQDKYCLLFGNHVVGTYDTEQAAKTAQEKEFANLMTVMYVPPKKSP